MFISLFYYPNFCKNACKWKFFVLKCLRLTGCGGMADAADSKSAEGNFMWVRLPPSRPCKKNCALCRLFFKSLPWRLFFCLRDQTKIAFHLRFCRDLKWANYLRFVSNKKTTFSGCFFDCYIGISGGIGGSIGCCSSCCGVSIKVQSLLSYVEACKSKT